MNRSASKAKRALAIVVMFFALCTFSLTPLMEKVRPGGTLSALPLFACFGVIGAEAILLAIWGALGPGPPWLRMLRSFGAGVVLYGIGSVGLVVSLNTEDLFFTGDILKGIVFALLLLPLIFLAIQTPLWIVRLVFRWDIAQIRPPAEMSPVRPWAIRDMLLATGVVGIALASARFAGSMGGIDASSDAMFWAVIASLLAYVGGISLVSSPLVVVATLRARRSLLGTVVTGIYGAIWLVVISTLMRFLEGRWPRASDMVYLSTTIVTFAAAMTTTLLIVRQMGFRLRWGKEARKPFRLTESTAPPDTNKWAGWPQEQPDYGDARQ